MAKLSVEWAIDAMRAEAQRLRDGIDPGTRGSGAVTDGERLADSLTRIADDVAAAVAAEGN